MKDRNIFSSKNPPSSWTRNPNHFLKNFDLSGVAVYVDKGTSANKSKKSGVLISNKHVLFARHSIAESGESFDVKFVNNNNEVFNYTVSNTLVISNTDIVIGVLSTTIDSSLCYYKTLSSSFDNFYETIIDPVGSGLEMPVVFIDQDKNISIGDGLLRKSNYGGYPYHYIWDIKASKNLKKYSYCEGVISGDSGNAVFCILNGELIILGTWMYTSSTSRTAPAIGNSIGGLPAVHKLISSINAAMTTLAGSSYALTQISNNFNSYTSLKIPSVTISNNIYAQSVSSYNRSPDIKGYGQESKTVSLDDDGYVYGPVSLNSDLSYQINPSSPYLGLTTNNLVAQINDGGNSSSDSSNIIYKALTVPAPVLNNINNTNNKRPTISGTWTQTELPTYSEDIFIDIYDNNVIISTLGDITISNVKSNNTFSFTFTPSSDLEIGSHTIKAKAYFYDGTNANNISSFSNSVTFDVLDTGGS
jgi:hypothetical protein